MDRDRYIIMYIILHTLCIDTYNAYIDTHILFIMHT